MFHLHFFRGKTFAKRRKYINTTLESEISISRHPATGPSHSLAEVIKAKHWIIDPIAIFLSFLIPFSFFTTRKPRSFTFASDQ